MSGTDAPHALKQYPPPENAVRNAYVSGRDAYDKLAAEAEGDHEGFWARRARELVTWKKPFTKVLNADDAPFFKWFEDGTLNVSYNCLDRNVERGLGDKTAIIFEADDGTVTKHASARSIRWSSVASRRSPCAIASPTPAPCSCCAATSRCAAASACR